MLRSTYYEDGNLEIVVLGPMGSDEKNVSSSTKSIGAAIDALLNESELKEFLTKTNVKEIHIQLPEDWMDAEIVRGIMTRIDTADLVIINITPYNGINGAPSPNVFYELGLIHALGMPVICIAQEGTEIPFYARHNRINNVKSFDIEDIKDKLTQPLSNFLNPADKTDFTDNRISQFYGGLPITDISAAIGLATGYYYNFVSRLLTNGGLISFNKDKVKRLIIVRPEDVMNSYDEDKELLTHVLHKNGYQLELEKNLVIPPGDEKGGIWIEHIEGIVIDLPRTIYPLKISPRILSLQDRIDNPINGNYTNSDRNIALRQLSQRLLDRVERAILYHTRKEGERFRHKLLDFSTIRNLPNLLQQFGVSKNI